MVMTIGIKWLHIAYLVVNVECSGVVMAYRFEGAGVLCWPVEILHQEYGSGV